MPSAETKVEPRSVMIVPCFNESQRLNTKAYIDWALEHPTIAFYFVDDGSDDQTFEILKEMTSKVPSQLFAYQLKENQGKAEAVRQGIHHALNKLNPDHFGYWDADLATPLHEIPRFVDILDQRPDVSIVLGSRVKLLGRRIERNPLRHYLGRIFATAASLTLRLRVYDTQCGAKVFRNTLATRTPFEQPFTAQWVFDVQMLQRYIQGAPADSIVELPLMEWMDVAGSKVKPTDFLVAFFDLLKIWSERHDGKEITDTDND